VDSTKQVSLNVCYLLWKENPDPQSWPEILGKRFKASYPYEAMSELMDKSVLVRDGKEWEEEKRKTEISISELAQRSQRSTWSDEQIVSFLKGRPASDQQIRDLAEAFRLEEEDLRFRDLVIDSGEDVLAANMRYLFDLTHGLKGKVAEELGVNKSTITEWANGNRPVPETLKRLARYFGISWSDDLETTPIFLSYEPVSDSAKRRWLVERIKRLSPSELSRIFDALKKILE
jgi:transcriptional regulator with XRE-family HTH domain